jgi:hypothetical protein
MKRKTNLFYLSGDESNFLTFSNYGEALTGNFLATDWKLFPSRFLCIYLKYLDVDNVEIYNERKKQVIKYLTRSYENKLSTLRDYCLENNLKIENTIYPLCYLLESLLLIENNENGTVLKISEHNITNMKSNIDKGNFKLFFIGDITEQDYNGIYTDIINIINSTDKPRGEIVFEENFYEKYAIESNDTLLHGWTKVDFNLDDYNPTPVEYTPLYDNGVNQYYINSVIKGISFNEIQNEPNIKFNLLLPLYDLVNISTHTNSTIIQETEYIIDNNVEKIGFSIKTNDDTYIKNEPLGLWFSDDVVELKRNVETGYSPAWSLMLSTQFKPFPYSQKMPSEVTNDSSKEAFATYSQVLMRQNKLLDKFETIFEKVNLLEQKYTYLMGKLNTVGTSYTSDNLRIEMMNFEKYQQDKMDAFKDEVYSYLLNKWKGYIG